MVINKEVLDYKSSYLFSKEEMFRRETVSQTEFNAAFQPMAVEVMAAIGTAGDLYNIFMKDHPVMERDKHFSAMFWNSAIREELMKIPGVEWGHLPDPYRRFFLKFGKAMLFVKKVDEKYSIANIDTATVQMYRQQLTDNENDKDAVLILGYQLNETRRQVIDVSVVCRKGESIEWVTDVYDLCKSEKMRPAMAGLHLPHSAVSEPAETPMIRPKPGLAKVKRE